MRFASDCLRLSGLAERSLKAGSYAPGFRLSDTDGRQISSSVLLERGPLVLAFFSGTWCAGCNLDLRALEQARSAIEVRGAALVAISQQTVDTNLRTRHSVGACFPILSDRGGRLSGMFGVRWRVPVVMRASHGMKGIDLPSTNGEGSWTCSVPARFVIARCVVIVYSEVHLFQTKPSDPCDLLLVLDTLRDARAE